MTMLSRAWTVPIPKGCRESQDALSQPASDGFLEATLETPFSKQQRRRQGSTGESFAALRSLGRGAVSPRKAMKKYILFDHDGVLVDTEFWYFKAAERALGDIGLTLDKEQYLRDMTLGLGSWVQAKAAGLNEQSLSPLRGARNAYYQEYLRTEAIEIEGVVEALAELSKYARMAIVTTAKRADFEIIHEKRQIRQFMDFVLVREDYQLAKPHPEPYLTGLKRFGAGKEEALVVEDSGRGLSSAVAAGIDCVIVSNDFTKTHDFSQACYRIDALIELKEIILNVG
jgi:HAD superfamily hydrolase (TIGR01509 family)